MDIQSLLQLHVQTLQQEAQRKALLAQLDAPETKAQMIDQLRVALGQVDVLAKQLDAQRQTVDQARKRIETAIDTLNKSESISGLVAKKLSGLAQATASAASPAAAKPTASRRK